MSTIGLHNIEALDRLKARFMRLVNPDATPLMLSWMRTIDDDNRKGVLAGLDRDGNPLKPVTYRPKPVKELTRGQRLNQKKNARKGFFAGLGVYSTGVLPNNNLTSAEYRRLDGPPLAPRRQFSRVITNLKTGYGRESSSSWYALGYWDEVVTPKGKPFLHYLFAARDLRGVRPDGVAKARVQARNWMTDMVRTYS